MNNPTREIIEEFAYHYIFSELTLPKSKQDIRHLDRLRDTYIKKLPFISLTSEAAKREFYIAPLLLELLDYIPAEIDVEYPLDAGDNLSGTIDYFIKLASNFVIIEAQKGDLEKGFNQLAVEFIALDKSMDSPQSHLYGAVYFGGCLAFWFA
ncbi:hypothetical protein [Candidatus Venteria ishoeyi]|uniref:Type I restriction enzyme R protein N-terminal domain-containing protein n=1 Tax=Candidatus Venteria ishoeyi TaxID=1899563 RepID=A0A1H6F8S0_9GAMM|nr:hypothetical protein [Candidatus Venteria ishoeyi]SEH05385.1 Uncharacterised protein [Candidatus Venteria ishoeyi]